MNTNIIAFLIYRVWVVEFVFRVFLSLSKPKKISSIGGSIFAAGTSLSEIKVIYDIGAHKGFWYVEQKPVFKNASFYLFEASKANEHFLRMTDCYYKIVALSSSEGNRQFFQSSGSMGNSFYQENTPNFDTVEPISVETHTLDEIVLRDDLPLPDLVKVDTQGSELDILAGANKTLKYVKFIVLEIPLIIYNKNAPRMSDYFTYLETIGFRPLGIVELHMNARQLIQFDVIFERVSIAN